MQQSKNLKPHFRPVLDDPASMFELAELAAKTGQFDQAIALMNNAIPLDHKNKWYLERLAQLYRITGDLKAFVKTYRELLKLQPDDIEYIGELSSALLLLGETNEAIDLLNQIETQTGVNEMLSQQKQAIHLSQGKPDKAIDEIKKLSDTFPGETRYLTMLADLYKKMGKPKKLLKFTKESPAAMPTTLMPILPWPNIFANWDTKTKLLPRF